MPRKEFESFTRLDASDVNTFLMDQTVQSFADSTARASAITTPVEGMVTYLNDIDSLSVYNGTAFTTDRTIQVFAGTAARGSAIGTAIEGMYTHINETDSLEYYNGTAWESVGGGGSGVLQVVSVTKSDTFETPSTTFVDVTGLTASITPSSATSKILVLVSMMIGLSGDITMQSRLLRNSTNIAIGDAANTRERVTLQQTAALASANFTQATFAINHLDSPATTSAITYKMEARVNSGTGYINRSGDDGDNINRGRGISSITLMEVAG
jgi:hypothetical protein